MRIQQGHTTASRITPQRHRDFMHEIDLVKHDLQHLNNSTTGQASQKQLLENEMHNMRSVFDAKENNMKGETMRLENELKDLRVALARMEGQQQQQQHQQQHQPQYQPPPQQTDRESQLAYELAQVKANLELLVTQQRLSMPAQQPQQQQPSGETIAAMQFQMQQQYNAEAAVMADTYVKKIDDMEKEMYALKERLAGAEARTSNLPQPLPSPSPVMMPPLAVVPQSPSHQYVYQPSPASQMVVPQSASPSPSPQLIPQQVSDSINNGVSHDRRPPLPPRHQRPESQPQQLPEQPPTTPPLYVMEQNNQYSSVVKQLTGLLVMQNEDLKSKDERLKTVISISEKSRSEGTRVQGMRIVGLESKLLDRERELESTEGDLQQLRDQLIAAKERRIASLMKRERPSATPVRGSMGVPVNYQQSHQSHTPMMHPVVPMSVQQTVSKPVVPPSPVATVEVPTASVTTPQTVHEVPTPSPVDQQTPVQPALLSLIQDASSPNTRRLEEGEHRLQQLQRELEFAQDELRKAAEDSLPMAT